MITAQATCDCGWQSKLTSPAFAGEALSAHSCDRQRRQQAATAKAAARELATDRTPKPCLHKRVTHQHGEYTCYNLDHCRCLPCAAANSTYESTRTRLLAYGQWQPYVDAAPTRAHLEHLMAAGMGLKRVAALSGLAHGALAGIVWGRRRSDGTTRPVTKVRRDTAARVLAVRLDLAGGQLVDATGTRRRLQALLAIGYSKLALAGRLGMTPANAGRMLCAGRVTVATARAAQALFDELAMTFPPAENQRQKISVNRTLRFAASRGWAPPLAWDDEHIDDPAGKPAGNPNYVADLLEPVAWHHRHGHNDTETGAALGRGKDTIRAVRNQLGLPATGRRYTRKAAA